MVSNSISFQPEIHFSTSICVMGEASSPVFAISLSSSSSCATPPPAPPKVKAGRTMTGYPIFSATPRASSIVVAISDGTVGCPISSIVSLKSSLSSALSMASTFVPISLTPCSVRKPSFSSCMEMVSPVCPPRPARRLSGFSFSMILLSVSTVSGSR